MVFPLEGVPSRAGINTEVFPQEGVLLLRMTLAGPPCSAGHQGTPAFLAWDEGADDPNQLVGKEDQQDKKGPPPGLDEGGAGWRW